MFKPEEIYYEKGGSKPKPEVRFGDTLLTEGTDYTLSYRNNTGVNNGTIGKKVPLITITGRGNFVGSRTVDFKILPKDITDSIKEAFCNFGRKIKGFDKDDTILAAVESRTSSPVRIARNEGFESNISGIYPCGEGAGYAGGITSAAMDGIKVAEEIGRRYEG